MMSYFLKGPVSSVLRIIRKPYYQFYEYNDNDDYSYYPGNYHHHLYWYGTYMKLILLMELHQIRIKVAGKYNNKSQEIEQNK